MKHIFDYGSYIRESATLLLCHEKDKSKLSNPKAAVTSGDQVSILKNLLKLKGYLKAFSLDNNDRFDDATRDAVIAFQKANKLKVDAIVGNETFTTLRKSKSVEDSKAKTDNNTPASTEENATVLCHPKLAKKIKGAASTGSQVANLRNLLRIKGYLTGISLQEDTFDDATHKAVLAFQKNNKLKQDGIVGEITLSKLKDKNSVSIKTPQAKKPAIATTATTKRATEEGWFSKIINYAKTTVENLTELLRIPTHYRMAWLFLGTNKKTVNEKFFTKSELITLYNVIEYKKELTKKEVTVIDYEDFSKWAVANGDNENVYKNTMKYMDKHYKNGTTDATALTSKSITSHLSMSFGTAAIKKTPTGYLVIDNYDFNQVAERPEEYEWNKFPETMKNSIKKICDGNHISGFEDILSWAHKMGYKGYPVKVNVNPQELGIQDDKSNIA
jgi:peptidoglycan hydrolase-like protein with peptidoglycan-binding domain